jgi:hypothetical protein
VLILRQLMHKLILIEKYLPTSFFWSNLVKDKKIQGLSVEELLEKYQGFEGELVFYFQLNGNIELLEKNIGECLELKILGKCTLLHVIDAPNTMPPSLENQVTKLGYDVGVCDEKKTIYSSIFHEILFGHHEELVVYKEQLNENFLFETQCIANKYVKMHDELSAQGKSVEDYEKMTVYEIWNQ